MAPLALVAVVVIGVSVGPLTPVGQASSFGGLVAASVGSWTDTVDPIVAPARRCDDFDGSGGALDGRAASCGSTWSATGANWRVSGGTVTGTGSAGVATVDAGSSNATVAVDVIGASANNRRGGVVVAHSSLVYLAAVLEASDGLRVMLVSGNSTTTLATATVPIGQITRLALTRNGADVTVTVDGVQHVAVTLKDGPNTALTGTGAGLSKGQGPPGEFDEFEVTLP
ncbi:hypothetical protein BH23ACT3_BH23ACT3_01890 [soil metagenome]